MKRRVFKICFAIGVLAFALALCSSLLQTNSPVVHAPEERIDVVSRPGLEDGAEKTSSPDRDDSTPQGPDAEKEQDLAASSGEETVEEVEPTPGDGQSPAFVMPEGAEYENKSALVEIGEQADMDKLRQAFSDSLGGAKVEHLADSFVRVEYASDISVEEAVNRIIESGYAQAAQPNYTYHVLEESTSLEESLSASGEAPNDQDALDAAEAEAEAREEAMLGLSEPVDDSSAEEGEGADSDEDASGLPGDKADGSPVGLQAQSVTTTDSLLSQQWALSSIKAYEAWSYAKCEQKVTVAALDLGVQTGHEDLKANIVDPYNAYNAVHGGSTANVSPVNTYNDHGSHVAGIISAVANNKKGVAGASYNAYLMPIKVVDSQGKATSSELVKAYDYVMGRQSARNVRVINLSMGIDARNLGSGSMSLSADDAVLKKVKQAYDKGIVTVAAAGNAEASKTKTLPYPCYPSDSANIVSVINLQKSGSSVVRHDSSNYNGSGETTKNISAPGTSILSTIATNSYGEKTGTSMAAPLVSAVLALEFSANPNLSAAEAIKVLYGTSTDLGGSMWTNEYGWGEVNAAAATKAARDGMTAAQKKKASSAAGSTEDEPTSPSVGTSNSVSYRTHVQRIGWQSWKSNGLLSGTTGQSLRLEGIQINLANQKYSGGIEYRTHVQSYGWESSWRSNGATSGTTGQGKRLEAIQIRLTGDMASKYDVWYRVHSQSFGWLGWAKNGENAGTAGYSYRLEAIQVRLLEKGSSAPGNTSSPYRFGVHYRGHVQRIGWQSYVHDGAISGTTGQGLRVEAININVAGAPYTGSIQYRTHVQSYGWQGWCSDGGLSGTTGQGKRLEAIQIRLTGDLSNKYDVWYRAHSQGFGWLGWAKNGANAGSAGYSYRMEAIQIRLVAKGGSAPGSTANAFHEK